MLVSLRDSIECHAFHVGIVLDATVSRGVERRDKSCFTHPGLVSQKENSNWKRF